MRRLLTSSLFPDDAIAVIYKPARSAMTSGTARTRQWKLRFERRSAPFGGFGGVVAAVRMGGANARPGAHSARMRTGSGPGVVVPDSRRRPSRSVLNCWAFAYLPKQALPKDQLPAANSRSDEVMDALLDLDKMQTGASTGRPSAPARDKKNRVARDELDAQREANPRAAFSDSSLIQRVIELA